MTEIKFYKPVGGILSAELFYVGDLESELDMVEGAGVAVELIDYKSSYEELLSADNGLVSVAHTLTLASDRNLAREWLSQGFVQRCTAEGVVARVTMATGEEIVVGTDPRFGFEQALRLSSLGFQSGCSPNDSPRVILTLKCHDTHSAMEIQN